MSDDVLNRLAVLGALGALAASSVVTEAGAVASPPAVGSAARDPSAVAEALLAPLREGSRLGRWRIERVVPLTHGAVSVVLCDRAGQLFQLDVCARDLAPGAPRGPASTELFEVFLANGGDGATGTHEDHGLAAMALAELIRGNEARVDRSGFLTLTAHAADSSVCSHIG